MIADFSFRKNAQMKCDGSSILIKLLLKYVAKVCSEVSHSTTNNTPTLMQVRLAETRLRQRISKLCITSSDKGNLEKRFD